MRKNILRRTFAVTLILTLILTSAVTAFAGMSNFSESKSYPGFSDVAKSAWYYSDVSKSCKLGLFKGYPDGKFKPTGNFTLAEAVKVAAVVRATYEGEAPPTNYDSGEWYENYVAYAKDKGIIKSGDFSNYSKNAKRSEMAYIFSRALPSSEYNAINNVTTLPDVTSSTKYQSNIFTLYNAGVLRGDDDYGTFRPSDNIARAEAAAIINRVALKSSRLMFTLKTKGEAPTPGGVMTESQTITYIRESMNNIPDSGWTGRPLDSEQKRILEKIKADPKNCYPEFNSVEEFTFTQQGASFTFYTEFVATVLMCYGDINNYNDGQY